MVQHLNRSIARRLLARAGLLLVVATSPALVAAQPCDQANPLVSRIYVEITTLYPLESTQLIATVEGRPPVTIQREGQRWIVDLSQAPVPPNAKLSIEKAGWQFPLARQPGPATTETTNGVSRCIVSHTFTGVRVWQVYVAAEPNPIVVNCDDRACEAQSRTAFTSKWIELGRPFTMSALFLEAACPAKLGTTESKPEASFLLRDLVPLVPESCRKGMTFPALLRDLPNRIELRTISR